MYVLRRQGPNNWFGSIPNFVSELGHHELTLDIAWEMAPSIGVNVSIVQQTSPARKGSLAGGRISDRRHARAAKVSAGEQVDAEKRLADQIWGVGLSAGGVSSTAGPRPQVHLQHPLGPPCAGYLLRLPSFPQSA